MLFMKMKVSMLICVTDVTDFMGKVRGEDTLTVADSFDKFVYSATNLMKAKDREYSLLCAGRTSGLHVRRCSHSCKMEETCIGSA